MKECLVVGQPNVGKTAFALAFAEYLGVKRLEIEFSFPDGFCTKKEYPLNIARKELISAQNHNTRSLQSIIVQIPAGKIKHTLKIMDTTGLINGIHENQDIRLGMAQTLRALEKTHMVIHIFDAHRIGSSATGQGIGLVDHQIARYMRLKGAYIIVSNKMDLPQSKNGLEHLQSTFPSISIIGLSAITKMGMREVKKYVAKYL